VLHFANRYQLDIPVTYGRTVLDWWSHSNEPALSRDCVQAWSGPNKASQTKGQSIRLFKTTWENPLPQVKLESLDLIAGDTPAAPFLIAITVE
jgi:hypothetical protein